MGKRKPDFSGWATKNNVLCADGRTIKRDAFIENDGMTVPLVYQHDHNDPENILGHALLENRPEGVYCYGYFNDTERAKNTKSAVENGDITAMSIYANKLKQTGKNVIHGMIREVSLVLAGANPEAIIDHPYLAHSDGSKEYFMDEAVILYDGVGLELEHSEEEEEEMNDIDDEVIEHGDGSEENKDDKEETVQDVFNSLTPKQKDVVYYIIGEVMKSEKSDEEDDDEKEKHSYEGEDKMKKNVFDKQTDVAGRAESTTLSHAEEGEIIGDAKKYGTLKESFLAHAQDYGIDNIGLLYPEAKNYTKTPEFISRNAEWVNVWLAGITKTPFSRVKSVLANITEDEARAKGYLKGKLKKEEVFSLLKRSTDPQTIYKKQKIDRDDQIDITDFDVVTFIKSEMRVMLNEELAAAMLVGDGRLTSSDDHISEDHIRPVVSDKDLFTYKIKIDKIVDATTAKAAIKAIIKGYKNYRGSGNRVMFIKESALDEMLLIEDGIGHLLYSSPSVLATVLRVKQIVSVPDEIFERNTAIDPEFVILDPKDYVSGADKGGEVNLFDDFDIDYNQQKYLMETRCSGALVKPFSAMVGSTKVESTLTTKSPVKVDENGNVVSTEESPRG